MRLAGWGRHPVAESRVVVPRDAEGVAAAIRSGPVIARGAGRAYGDAAIGAETTLDMRRMDRMLAFDPSWGVLEAEAGVRLGDVVDTFLPRGWFPAVTPGTRHVTLGGMIAADVHGKNHHRAGSMASTVVRIDVMDGDGRVHRLAPGDEAFGWTCGGMGLTGVILSAAVRLRPVETAWIRRRTVAAPDLAAAIDLFEQNLGATYAVAWIDCQARGRALGRSVVMFGEHAGLADLDAARRAAPLAPPPRRRLAVPFDLPPATLTGPAMRAFNAAYHRLQRARAGTGLVDVDRFFYPLDAVAGWNRAYGRRGFVQFQCVLPLARSRDGLEALLGRTAAAGEGSFLAVLKRLGPADGPFSFPMEGYTLALDFPATPAALALVDDLHDVAAAAGGRVYLAKDARMRAHQLRVCDPRASAFAAMRIAAGHAGAFASLQSRRLGL